jgi:hypothetical protein
LGTLYEPNSSSGQAHVAEDEIIDDHSPDLIWSGHQGRVLPAKVSSPSGSERDVFGGHGHPMLAHIGSFASLSAA